jgi:PPOX class probable F420-dependent enzyme
MVRGRLRTLRTVVDDPGRVGNGRRMSPDEARAFVASNHRAVLVTRRSGGGLQTSPVLIGVDDQGMVVISTREGAYKTRNLRRDPRVVLCVLSDDFFGRWIRIDGTAQVVSLPEAMEGLVDYYRGISGEHPDWDEYRRAMRHDRRVLVRVSVDAAGPAHAR